MTEYRGNSDREREKKAENAEVAERPKQDKVATGRTTQRRKNIFQKLSGFLKSSYVVETREAIAEIIRTVQTIMDAADVLTGGRRRGGGGWGESSVPASRVSYRRYYDDDRDDYRGRSRDVYDYEDILFETRDDAEMVLLRMEEVLDRFPNVSVADLFDLAGITCNYTDHKYGWAKGELRGSRVRPVRGGYVLDLPPAKSL